ncbi:MAG: hypothetical protein ACI9L6_001262 [Flavobacterium sp.]|jgi:hypothetical protein
MKKTLLIAFLFIGLHAFAQNSVKILYHEDVMTDKEYIYTNESLLSLDGKKIGFTVKPSFTIKKGVFGYSGIIVESLGIGTCLQKDDLTFLFEDNTKVTLKSYSKFNCKGISKFDLYGTELSKLTKRIKAVRFLNGRSFESLTILLEKEKDKTFFIDVKRAIDKQAYEVVDEM